MNHKKTKLKKKKKKGPEKPYTLKLKKKKKGLTNPKIKKGILKHTPFLKLM